MGWIAPAISAVGGLVGGILNWNEQKGQNRRDRMFQREMYGRQRQDALADWTREAEYNSPEQQMERLRQAGLNPNLVYGKGADNTARSVRSSTAQTPNQIAPKWDVNAVMSPLLSYFNIKQMQENTDKLAEQAALLKKEQLYKDAQTLGELAKTSKTKEETWRLKNTHRLVMDQMQSTIDQTEANTEYTISENQRKELANSANVNLTLEKVLTEKLIRSKTEAEARRIEAMIDNVKADTNLKVKDLELRKNGIYPGDPAWLRLMTMAGSEDSFLNDIINRIPKLPKSKLNTTKHHKRQFSPTGKF